MISVQPFKPLTETQADELVQLWRRVPPGPLLQACRGLHKHHSRNNTLPQLIDHLKAMERAGLLLPPEQQR